MNKQKYSGAGWLGDIPSHWRVDKLKYHLKRNEPRNPGGQVVLSLYRELGVIPKDSRDDNHNVTSEDTSNYKYVRPGDFVINKMKAWQGSVAVSDYEGIVSPAYFVYNFIDDLYFKRYFHYLLRGCYKDEFMRLSGGIRVGQWDLPSEALGNVLVLIPPLNEQESISAYLDSRCGEIDVIIADIQTQITVLEQYKSSVITEAVTHGLDPNVELIDSGRDWCPKIPAHWIPTNPKALFSLRNQRAKDGDRQLTASQKLGIVYQDEFMEAEGQKVVTVEKDFSILKHVEPNDFVISMRSFQGGLEYSELRGSISSAYVMLIPNKEKVHPPFYRWFFKSSKYINAIQSTTNLVRDGQAMRYANFVKVPLFIIPMHEQIQIADYLNNRIPQIDAVISEKQEQISILTAYKKSLIFEYVTGKKEVPALITAVMVDPNVILLGKLPKLLSQQKGKIYNQKVLYLLNIYLGLNLGVQYYRYKHGPYDVRLDSYIDTLIENGWCVKTVNNGAENLEIGPNYGAFEEKYDSYFSEYAAEIKNLIQFVQPMKRSQIERVATLFAVWNDMILDGKSMPTDAEIVSEVMSGWTENKANFAYDTWLGTLNKMRNNGIIPKGQGLHTLPRDC